MKTLLLVVFGLLVANSIFSQSPGYIIVDGDTLKLSLEVKKRKSGDIIYFQYQHELQKHNLTAENAEVVCVPEKWKYISTALPLNNKNVWAQCFFDGAYKLVYYQSKYYLITDTKTIKLIPPTTEEHKNTFKGQLIALLASRLDFNYNKLKYDSKSLVQPLILLHQQEELPYVDYNKQIIVEAETSIEVGYANIQGRYLSANMIEFNPTGNAFSIGAIRNYTYPEWSKRFIFSAGGKFNTYRFNQYLKTESVYGTAYADLSCMFYSVGVQGSFAYYILKLPEVQLLFKAGLELSRMFGKDSNERIEILDGDIIQTEFNRVSVTDAFLLHQFDQLIFGLPNISKSVQIGLGGSFLLNKIEKEANTFSIGNSLNFSVYYNF